MKTAFIFPAFISEFFGNEIQLLESESDFYKKNSGLLAEISGINFKEFSLDDKNITEDELGSQMVSYLFSCSLSDLLASKKIIPDFLAGYSMGLYATMYTGKAISFEEGVMLIKKAFEISKKAIQGIESAMGSIIGLTSKEIESLIGSDKLDVEIANTNSIHSHLVTGTMQSVNKLLKKSRETGALNVSLLNVSTPYHSNLLKNTHAEFNQFIHESVVLKNSVFPIISGIDQRVIHQKTAIAAELVNNLYKRINWMNTFDTMLKLKVSRFIECGAGKSLFKLGRFCSGDFKIYPINKVQSQFTSK